MLPRGSMSEKRVKKFKRVTINIPMDVYEEMAKRLPKNSHGLPSWTWFFTSVMRLYLFGDISQIQNLLKSPKQAPSRETATEKGEESTQKNVVVIDGVEFTLKPVGNIWESESLFNASSQTSRQSDSGGTRTPLSQEDTGGRA
ncbi:MAG: hypothetical protein QXT14_08115 [Candidatus Bathyarchaeia archaeon]